MHFLIACYVVLAVVIVRSLILLGANVYRAGQTNSAPPPLIQAPTLPRFGVGVGTNGKGQRDPSDRLPEV